MTNKVAVLLEKAKSNVMEKDKRDQIGLWQALFTDVSALNKAERSEFETSFRNQLQENVAEIFENESRRSRRGGKIRPVIMSAQTGQFIFENFNWNDPSREEMFSAGMNGLRDSLKGHSQSSDDEMERQKDETHKVINKEARRVMWVGLIIVILFVARLLYKGTNMFEGQF